VLAFVFPALCTKIGLFLLLDYPFFQERKALEKLFPGTVPHSPLRTAPQSSPVIERVAFGPPPLISVAIPPPEEDGGLRTFLLELLQR